MGQQTPQKKWRAESVLFWVMLVLFPFLQFVLFEARRLVLVTGSNKHELLTTDQNANPNHLTWKNRTRWALPLRRNSCWLVHGSWNPQICWQPALSRPLKSPFCCNLAGAADKKPIKLPSTWNKPGIKNGPKSLIGTSPAWTLFFQETSRRGKVGDEVGGVFARFTWSFPSQKAYGQFMVSWWSMWCIHSHPDGHTFEDMTWPALFEKRYACVRVLGHLKPKPRFGGETRLRQSQRPRTFWRNWVSDMRGVWMILLLGTWIVDHHCVSKRTRFNILITFLNGTASHSQINNHKATWRWPCRFQVKPSATWV